MKNQRIIFLIPYFGKWPFWMPFFIESCRHNPDIQWQFFTDCPIPVNSPDNIRYSEISFDEYNKMVSDRLGIHFNPRTPYKLCDLKPAMGYLHQDKISGYGFWGFGDIDLIYGNLRAYFSPQRLDKFDLISTHERRVSGHLCLIRNTQEMLECFKRVPQWKEKLENSEHTGFDEGAFSRLFIRYKQWPFFLRSLLSMPNRLWRHSEFYEAFSTPNGRVPWHDGSFNFPDCWKWSDGKLTNSKDGDRQFPYFHFIAWKDRSEWKEHAENNFIRDAGLAQENSWKITPQCFMKD